MDMTMERIRALSDRLHQTLSQVATERDLEAWYRAALSRSGEINQLKKTVGSLPPEERRSFGQMINSLASALELAFKSRKDLLENARIERELKSAGIDVTLPPRARRQGGYHPISTALREICDIFSGMGFHVFDTPNVELDEFNFQLLNIPKHHPARDMQDTFYVSDDVVLRTHTSPGQIRAMRTYAPDPCQVILPGLCYRYENITPRSEIQFHQIEGLLVGPLVRFSDLKGILLRFARMAYGDDQQIRLRGSYFPFTEPSVEVDIRCTICHGTGCRVCKHSGWLEMLGAGLVHPQVLQNGGYSPHEVRGIAFGMGIERNILLRHRISDIRYFFENDTRFLRQFQ
jgi:phenylalanyl-tRNA synthetase alpha chain